MNPVTDPAILAQLNGPDQKLKPVTDPAVLAQLNAAPTAPPADSRLTENIGGFLGENLGKAITTPDDGLVNKFDNLFGIGHSKGGKERQTEETKQIGQAFGLSIENMAQAIRQYVPGMDRDSAIKAASQIKERMEQLPGSAQLQGGLAATAMPFGAAGKLATGAKAYNTMSKAEKAAQALKTIGAGGAANAALTPVTTEGEFGTKKLEQGAEGAAGTAILGGGLSGLKSLAGRLHKAWQSGDSEAAAIIQKSIDALGFKPQTLNRTAGAAGAEVTAAKAQAESAAESAKTVEQHAADRARIDKERQNVVSMVAGNEAKTAEEAAQYHPASQVVAGRGGASAEAIGDQIRAPLSARKEALEMTRATETGKLKQIALSRKDPVPTQGIIDYLESSKKAETIQGKKDIDKIIKDLTGYDAAPVAGNTSHGIPSRKLENVKSDIQAMKAQELASPHINGGRVEMLSNAEKMLAGATPEWKNFFEQYGKHSAPLDAFTTQEGAKIGSLTKVNPLTGAHDIPSEKVADHILDGGVTRVRAVLAASDNYQAVRKGLEKSLWSDLNASAKNNKLTAATMDTFMKKNTDVLKELGLTSKFEAQRGMVGLADAIDKTAAGKIALLKSKADAAAGSEKIKIGAATRTAAEAKQAASDLEHSAVGKLGEAQGNAVDAFTTLGKILDAPTGRREGLEQLVKLTANDPQARAALKYGVIMHGVTQRPASAGLTRAAVLPDLEASGLFSKQDMIDVHKINQVFDQTMKIGASNKTTAGSIVASVLSHVPGLKTGARMAKGALAKESEVSAEATRNQLLMAATDPKEAKNLLSVPTEQTIQAGLTAMNKAAVFMAAQKGVTDGDR